MKVVEIFQSIDGEANRAGFITNFIRLSECNLRCSYCDTCYAQNESDGVEMNVNEILNKLDFNIKNVTLTGGEPLLHKENASCLLKKLIENGFNVSVETNGSINIKEYIEEFPTVSYIVDYKSPSSNMENKMILENFEVVRNIDCVKFVVSNLEDLKTMEKVYKEKNLEDRNINVFVSAVFNEINFEDIVNYLKLRKLNGIRLQLQMHKIIWNPMKKGV